MSDVKIFINFLSCNTKNNCYELLLLLLFEPSSKNSKNRKRMNTSYSKLSNSAHFDRQTHILCQMPKQPMRQTVVMCNVQLTTNTFHVSILHVQAIQTVAFIKTNTKYTQPYMVYIIHYTCCCRIYADCQCKHMFCISFA